VTDTFLSIRIPHDLAVALKAEQERTGCSVSEFTRRALVVALNKKAESK
jgi:hypothetical protein